MSHSKANAGSDGKLAFIGFGEAASAFVQGWGASGVFDATAIQAFDIKTDDPNGDVRAAQHADYQRAGVTGAETPASALRDAAVVFSTVTADQALVAAESAAAELVPGALYFDCNSCAPDTKRKAARLIDGVGGRYVDVAVMAPVHPALHRVPLLISGPHAEAALPMLEALDMKAEVSSAEVGVSSSIKMIRSIMIKGLEALVMECVLSGRKAGVDDVVLDSLDKSFPGFDWKARATYMLERAATHGVRRAAEMREVALTVEQLGLSGDMAQATVRWQQRIGDLGIHLDAIEGYGARADALLEGLGK